MRLLLTIFLIACSSIKINQSVDSYFGDLLDSIYYVSVKDIKSGKSYRATGIALSEDSIITVAHVIPKDHNRFKIFVKTGFKTYKATIVDNFEQADLLVLKIDRKTKNNFKKLNDIVLANDPVFVLTEHSKGVISCRETIITEVSTFNLKIKGRFFKGYSGSVILNSRKEILGIMVRSNFEEVDKEKYGVILRIEAIEFLLTGKR